MVLKQLYIHMQKKKMNLDTVLTLQKNYLKWTAYLNVKYKTVKLLEYNGESLDDLEYGDYFLDRIPKAQPMK